jgi:hypothetical protein
MAAQHSNAVDPDGNPADDIWCELTGLLPIACRISVEHDLMAVAMDLRLKSSTARAGRTR